MSGKQRRGVADDLLKREISDLLKVHGSEVAAARAAASPAGTRRKRPRDEARRAARAGAALGGGDKAPPVAAPSASRYNKAGPFFPSSAPLLTAASASASASAAAAPGKAPRDSGGAAAAAASARLIASLRLDVLAASRMTGRMGSGDAHWFDDAEAGGIAGGGDGDGSSAAAELSVAAAVRAGADSALMGTLRALAERLLREEVAAYESRSAGGGGGGGADERFMRNALAAGTGADRLAARVLLCARSPLHALRHVDALLAAARAKGRREASAAGAALKDLFLSNLLPRARKLRTFESRAGAVVAAAGAAPLSAERLVWWAWEDALKARVSLFFDALDAAAADGLPHSKLAALRAAAELLAARPEGEERALGLLVHKLGDPARAAAAAAQRALLRLVAPGAHEAMRPVLVRALQDFLAAPRTPPAARYAAVCTLNQVPLQRGGGGAALATELCEAYLGLFELTARAGALEARLLGALLTGVNRALPFAAASPEALAAVEARTDALFLVAAGQATSAAVQALILLQVREERCCERGGLQTSATGLKRA
jgi:hypothetical protein